MKVFLQLVPWFPGMLVVLAVVVPRASAAPVIAAAGDISCPPTYMSLPAAVSDRRPGICRQAETAAMVTDAGDYDAALALGDVVQPEPLLKYYEATYEASWGQFKSITWPALGNHEYEVPGARGYFDYFNGVGVERGAAGERGRGWYWRRLGHWLVIALNSNCNRVDCGPRSRQAIWLRRVLHRHPTRCALAFWHHPRFSSGEHGNKYDTGAFWRILQRNRADVVLNGHDHLYERFRPQDPPGNLDKRGIVQFTVGTGGRALFHFREPFLPGSRSRVESKFGILRLRLMSTAFRWNYITVDGEVRDYGTRTCNARPPL